MRANLIIQAGAMDDLAAKWNFSTPPEITECITGQEGRKRVRSFESSEQKPVMAEKCDKKEQRSSKGEVDGWKEAKSTEMRASYAVRAAVAQDPRVFHKQIFHYFMYLFFQMQHQSDADTEADPNANVDETEPRHRLDHTALSLAKKIRATAKAILARHVRGR